MKKTKLLLALLVVSSFILQAGFLYAQERKVGYVDLGAVFDSYEKTKEFDKVLEEKTAQKESERKKKTDEIKKLRDEIELLSEKAKTEKQNIFENKVKELQEFDRTTTGELKKERDTYVREILEEIEKTINGYAKENGFDLIFNSRVLLYGTEDLDLTGKIRDQLNAGYKPAPAAAPGKKKK